MFFADKLRQGQPKLSEEVEVRRNTVYQMVKSNVNVLEGVELSTGQPNSNEEAEVWEKAWKSLGKPSSPKNKITLNNQLIMGQPKSTEEAKDEKNKKRSSGRPNTLKKSMFQQIRQNRVNPI